jgi:hypothetical protein
MKKNIISPTQMGKITIWREKISATNARSKYVVIRVLEVKNTGIQ